MFRYDEGGSCIALCRCTIRRDRPWAIVEAQRARAKLHDGACEGMFRVIARDKDAAALLEDGENPVDKLVRKGTSPVIGFKDVAAKEATRSIPA